MSQPFVGEIRMFGGSFAPQNWAFCNGQMMAISEFEVLYTLLGTTYGGDGVNTFALPDLQGRLPIHQGNYQGTQFVIGQRAGTENETLSAQQIPNHNHTLVASPNPGHVSDPNGARIAADRDFPAYISIIDTNNPFTSMNAQMMASSGGSQPHNNVPPYLCVSFIISLFGIFPSQN